MSREGKLAKNTLIIAIGTFLPKVATLVILPILTGCLTKEEYGMYDLITVMVSLILPAATLQIQTAAFRFLIDVRGDEKKISMIVTNIIAFILGTSLVALVILFFCLFGQPVVIRILICLYFLADILVNAFRQVCRGINRNLDFSISAIVSAMGQMIFSIILVYIMHTGLIGAVSSLLAASVFSLIYLLAKTKMYRYFDPSCLSRDELKKLLGYSWPMVPNSLSGWVMRLSDRLVVTAVLGVSANAVYAVANKIPNLLNIAQNTFTLAWQENASVVSKDEDAGEYYSQVFQTMIDLMSGLFGVLIAMTPLLFVILIRGDYGEAYYQMPILFLGMFFYSMSTFLGGIYVAFLKTKSVGVTTTVAAITNLVVDIGLIHWIGIYAASLSTLVSYILLFVYRLVDVQKIIKIRYKPGHLLILIGIMVVESVLCYQQNMIYNMINLILGFGIFFLLNHKFLAASYRKGKSYIKRRFKK